MKRLISVMFVLVIAVSLTSCGSSAPKVLNFYTWSEYIDPEIYTMFEEETGIQVVEDTFGNNEVLLAKLQSGATGYDVIVPSDYMVDVLVKLDLVGELDHSLIPNIGNLDPAFTNLPFDPNMGHCLPYFWGATGIGFNWNDWDEAPNSWAYIFDPELAKEFEGKISLLDDMREVFGAALIYLGYSPSTTSETELAEARDLVIGVLPYIHTFESETYEDFLLTGETALAHGWSGEFLKAQLEDENIDFIIPKEGSLMWVDNICITKDAAADPARAKMAHQWLDFLNRPDIAAINTNFVWYASPNKAAESGISQEILDYPAIYPDEETISRLTMAVNVGDFTETWSRMWTEVKAGK